MSAPARWSRRPCWRIPLTVAARRGLDAAWLVLLGAAGLIPAVDLAVALVNYMVTRGFPRHPAAGAGSAKGVPPTLRTLVPCPTLLTSLEGVQAQIERLEIHYLASPQGELHFALLSDWADAAAETGDGDDALLAAARAAIDRLNQRYGPAPGGDRFLLLHRRRVWSDGEGCWIGWERKRGKLLRTQPASARARRDTDLLDPPAAPRRTCAT